MTIQTKFANLQREEPDPIIKTMTLYKEDPHPSKVDVSIGVYKAPSGELYTFPTVKDAKDKLYKNDPGHNYTTMAGVPEFLQAAQKVVFGDKFAQEGKVASLQAIGGSGALHMAMLLIVQAGYRKFYVGTPAWSNYIQMIEHAGGEIKTYRHYDETTRRIDFDAVLSTLESVDEGSVFLFQACCHNPTGADYTRDQWVEIIDLVKKRNHLVLFDLAYQGFSSGDIDEDAWVVRYAYEQNMEFLVAESLSKNLGLYSERVGCTHVVVQDKEYVANAQSTLVRTFRQECSFAPAFGARIAASVVNDPASNKQWHDEVAAVTKRMKSLRQQVYEELKSLGTPGGWSNVVEQNGLFWYSGLTPEQNQRLIDQHHVYSTSVGRVNIAGLNDQNVGYFCKAIDEVVRHKY
ncbi:Aspartate aminotransferase, cytoplasmic [Candida viswanathii]|uniref:Aspartate aminotransferase, cytoplasmic n=1 Tax=Candida viswanathii TaxID=5486 RepID=A0A367Y122_9ASCO|nr:Aspartate aminotransferase, cytoplasmic [Candida viswanathii]